MIRKLTALCAASILFAGGLTAVPARADDNDLVKVLAGVAAIAIIGSAIAQDQEAKAGQTAKSPTVVDDDDTTVADSCDGAYWDGKRWVADNGKPCFEGTRTAQAQRTPAVCLRERWQDGFSIKYFDKACMQNAGYRLSIWQN